MGLLPSRSSAQRMTAVVATLAGELCIKGRQTRFHMVRELLANISAVVRLRSSRVYGGLLVLDVDGDPSALSRVFGLAHYAVANEVRYDDLGDLVRRAAELTANDVRGRRFAVRARRLSEDRFTSLDVNRELGAALLGGSAGVDLESPEVTVYVDMVERGLAYVHTSLQAGPGGLPVGVAGRTVALVSGGIDSPVATWMIMRRGVVPVVLNLAIGGREHREAVLSEVKLLRPWAGRHDIKVYFIDGVPVMKALAEVRRPLRVIALKRVLYRLAEALARIEGAHSITTGESLSQVSSQTMWNLEAEEHGIELPILRPLIAMDKEDIVRVARSIGTYGVSAKVPEYCSLAGPSTTRASVSDVLEAEKSMNLDYAALVRSAEAVRVTLEGRPGPPGRAV